MTEFTHLNDIVVQGSVSSSEQGDLIGSFKSMPTASADNKDKIVLYTGETTGTFKKGMYYISNGSAWVLSEAPLYSTNDYTSEDKAKLDGIATGAQVNVIETVKVNGATQAVVNKAVNISVPTSYGFRLQVDTATGVISLLDKQGVVLSTINTTINRVIKSGYYDTTSGNIVLVTDDNTQINIPVSDLVDTYAADGTYLTLDERTFSLSGSAKAAVDAVADKADDSAVVHKTGNETIGGVKTFSSVTHVQGNMYIDAGSETGVIINRTDKGIEDNWARYMWHRAFDKDGRYVGEILTTRDATWSSTMIKADNYDSDGNKIEANLGVSNRGTEMYGYAPSWNVGTIENANKIVTMQMANSLPSLVHTTGNEMIAGNKTFSGIIAINSPSYNPLRLTNPSADLSAGTESYGQGIQFFDKNNMICTQVYNAISNTNNVSMSQLQLSARNYKSDGTAVYSTIYLEAKSDGTSYARCPQTPDDAIGNEIVTAKWALAKIAELTARIEALEGAR